MPSVASDVKAALKPPAPQQPLPAPERGSPSPFESLLDDSTPPVAQPEPKAKPKASDKTEPSTEPQESRQAAPDKDVEPSKQGKTAVNGTAGDSTKTGKADKDGATGKTESVDSDAKAEVKTDTNAAAEQVFATPDVTPPTEAAVTATAVTVAVVSAAADPLQPGVAGDIAAKIAAPITAARFPTATAAPASALTKATTANFDKADGKDESAPPDLQADAETAGAPAKAAAKTVAAVQAEGKPATDDKPACPAHPERPVANVQPDAAAPPQAAVKPAADMVQPLPMTAPAQHAPAAEAAAPAQLATQYVAQAVPLAGVPLEIAAKALAGKNHFEIRLDPPELGRIEVRLDVARDGSISSHVIADRRDTLDLLQRDASGLQRALEDAGLKTSDQSLQFSLRDQSAGREQQAPAAETAQLVVEDEAPLDPLPIYTRLASTRGGLDIRV